MPGRTIPRHLAAPLLLGMTLLAVYWVTMPPDVTLEDTAIFASACATWGLAHPPGYPLYTLVCAPVAQLAAFSDSLTLAESAALVSALAAAAACVVLARIVYTLTGSLGAAVLAAGVVGISPAYWSQAIIPEAYALNSLLVVASVAASLNYARGGRRGWLGALALLAGLGLANHWPIYLLTVPAFVLLLAPAWRRLLADRRLLPACAGLFLLGLLPYAHLLAVSSEAYLFIKDYGTGDFFGYVLREQYAAADSIPVSARQRLWFALQAAVWFVPQLHYVFGAMAAAGLGLMAARRLWWQLGAVVWGMLATTALLALIRPADAASDLSVQIFSVYPLPAYLLAAIPLGHSLAWLASWRRAGETACLAAAAAALFVVLAWRLPQADRSGDDIAISHARLVLAQAPPAALLIGSGGDYRFVYEYVKRFDAPREDVELADEGELYDLNDDGSISAAAERSLAQRQRPVAFLLNLRLKTLGRVYHGTHFTLANDVAPGATRIEIAPEVRDFYARVLEYDRRGTGNVWLQTFIDQLLIEYVTELEAVRLAGDQDLHPDDLRLFEQLSATPQGRYALFLALATRSSRPLSLPQLERKFTDLLPHAHMRRLPGHRRSDVLHLLATAYVLSGDPQHGRELLELALAEYPSYENRRVLTDLLQLHAWNGDFKAYAKLRGQYPGLENPALATTDLQCAAALHSSCVPQ